LEPCTNPFIPERLKTKGRPDLPDFSIGEKLFRRCAVENIDNPFDDFKLYDVSINRELGQSIVLSEANDVLRSPNPSSELEIYIKGAIVALVIKELCPVLLTTYSKEITDDGIDGANQPYNHSCVITLLHNKIPCNYSHCVFQIEFNKELVTKENYKNSLGKSNATCRKLRTKCKLEFEKMVMYKIIEINWEKK